MGATSTQCQGAATVTYTATANNTTGITYSLDAASISGSNTINALTGEVNFDAAWNGTTTITAEAAGCNGPVSATHNVTITASVNVPVFALGATSTQCQGAATVTYTATANNTTGITYSMDAASISGGNSINALTGEVSFDATWIGTTTITAEAAGCNGPVSATHTVTIIGTVQAPVFNAGTNSSRCMGADVSMYDATADYAISITYSLDAASLAAGNTINATTGASYF